MPLTEKLSRSLCAGLLAPHALIYDTRKQNYFVDNIIMSSYGSRYGVALPRSISKLVAVLGTLAIAYFLVHRLTQHTTLKDTSRHGNDMVGKSIQVYWPDQKAWYKARVTKYNVASSHGNNLEGTHTIVYEDDSVVHSMLHKLTYHVVYGKELVGHKIMLYRPTLGYSKVATVEEFDQEAQQHKIEFDDGGELNLDLSLEEFQLMFGKELVGRVIEIRREIHDEPLYASVLHYSEMKGTFACMLSNPCKQRSNPPSMICLALVFSFPCLLLSWIVLPFCSSSDCL